MNPEIAKILAQTLPESQHDMADVKLGSRGGFSIYSKKQPPLKRLFKAKRISFEQLLAGERIESLAYIAGLYAPSGTPISEKVNGSSGSGMSQCQLEAWQEYFSVCKEVLRKMGSAELQTMVQVAVYGCPPRNTTLLAKHKRMPAIRKSLQIAHDFLFTKRAESCNI